MTIDNEYIKNLQHALHRIPELGFDLPRTVAFVKGELDKIGIPYTEKYGKSSIVAELNPEKTKFTIAIRADMDALPLQEQTGLPSAAMELEDGTIITAGSSPLLGPSAALILNATKHLAGINHEVKLIPQSLIEPIQKTKTEYLGGNNPRLHTDEVLVALSVLSSQDQNCQKALEQLPKLQGCQVHSTVMLSEVDRKIFKKLGVGLTCDPTRKKAAFTCCSWRTSRIFSVQPFS